MKKQNKRPAENPLRAISPAEEIKKTPGAGKQLIQQYNYAQVLKSFPEGENTSIIHELIATGEAAFEFIWYSDIDTDLRNAFHQLHKQFSLYASLLTNRSASPSAA